MCLHVQYWVLFTTVHAHVHVHVHAHVYPLCTCTVHFYVLLCICCKSVYTVGHVHLYIYRLFSLFSACTEKLSCTEM